MKMSNAMDNSSAKKIIKYLNYCHDASIKKIEFIKNRDIDEENGSLIYPFSDINDMIKCDIKIELIHNNYKSSKINQIIMLEFKEVSSFIFLQNNDFDYSNLYEMQFFENNEFSFSFFATIKKIKVLEICCKKMILYEY